MTVQLTPYRSIPFHGFLFPVKSWGNLAGKITASFSASLAASRPATSSHFTLGFSATIALARAPFSFDVSAGREHAANTDTRCKCNVIRRNPQSHHSGNSNSKNKGRIFTHKCIPLPASSPPPPPPPSFVLDSPGGFAMVAPPEPPLACVPSRAVDRDK